MNRLQLGWIDFSKEQRNKVLSVINLLSEPGAVDELGVGIIRDAFSDIFFPGTSTIQTRAKYFLLVPYLLNELEQKKGLTADRMINRIHEQELDLIEILKKDGVNGVIGENAGRDLKRKPSDIYWNGIRTYGIFTGNKMSLHEYAKVSVLLKDKYQKAKAQGSLRSKNDEDDGDDKDALSRELSEGFWRLPTIPSNWREHLSIHLTQEEALFLRDRIRTECPDSLIGFILEKNYKEFLLIKKFDDIEVMINLLPDTMKADYLMAKAFADFIYGAHLRYNMILSNGADKKVNNDWLSWYEDIESHSDLDLHNILFNRLNIKNRRLIKFLMSCKEAMQNNDIDQLDQLVIEREIILKGKTRSKLFNLSEFEYKEWVGIRKLQYRLGNGKNIIEDIYEGLGDTVAKAD